MSAPEHAATAAALRDIKQSLDEVHQLVRALAGEMQSQRHAADGALRAVRGGDGNMSNQDAPGAAAAASQVQAQESAAPARRDRIVDADDPDGDRRDVPTPRQVGGESVAVTAHNFHDNATAASAMSVAEFNAWRQSPADSCAASHLRPQPLVAVAYATQKRSCQLTAAGRMCCGASSPALCRCGEDANRAPALKFHSGELALSRTTRSQARQGAPVARWSCCRVPAILPLGEPQRCSFEPEASNGCRAL